MGKGFTIDGTTMQTVIETAERLLAPGAINLGWRDISNVLLHDGETVIAFGSGTGNARAIKACDDTLLGYKTAAGMTRRPARALFRLTGPGNLLLREVNDVRESIERSVGTIGEVTFGVACDNSLNDEVRIILLATLEKEPRSSVNRKCYSAAEGDLVDEWTDKWLELIGFINQVTGADEPPWSSPPPDETDEIRYARLRFWFLSRQQQFVPLWNDFSASQHWTDSQDGSDPGGFQTGRSAPDDDYFFGFRCGCYLHLFFFADRRVEDTGGGIHAKYSIWMQAGLPAAHASPDIL